MKGWWHFDTVRAPSSITKFQAPKLLPPLAVSTKPQILHSPTWDAAMGCSFNRSAAMFDQVRCCSADPTG